MTSNAELTIQAAQQAIYKTNKLTMYLNVAAQLFILATIGCFVTVAYQLWNGSDFPSGPVSFGLWSLLIGTVLNIVVAALELQTWKVCLMIQSARDLKDIRESSRNTYGVVSRR